MVDGNAVYNHN